MPIERFEQLIAWQRAHSLVLSIYARCKLLPEDERFGLNLQMRRAAVSIPANIAEGFKRRTSKDKLHFYNISESSLEELKYYVLFCRDLKYWKDKDVATTREGADEVSRILKGLMRSL